ncbi:hypothetical protein LTR37_018903 [Vermiconidia calcicola]|uniref:Uncharacterized protein n=1 Tax=Vermiconidia calcicola TaxID=1690605 RepID=A0ACC3MFR6_9PEZI|nr:hypothetical protein LTR37_018903 [Vermiconidia calcicola]
MARVQAEEKLRMLRDEGIPEDAVGIIPGTFIMPFGKNRPSWFDNYKGRMRLERKRWRTRLTEVAMIVMRWWITRPRPKLEITKPPGIVKDLHQKMYSHFAAGNLEAIEPRLCPGLLNSLRRRISLRSPNTHLKWTLHKYLSKPKLVSYRAMQIPGQKSETSRERNGVTQAIVRIHSLQSLQHVKRVTARERGLLVTKEVVVDSKGNELPGATTDERFQVRNAKESVEYLVLQRIMKQSTQGPWKLWGNAEETTLSKLDSEQRKKR